MIIIDTCLIVVEYFRTNACRYYSTLCRFHTLSGHGPANAGLRDSASILIESHNLPLGAGELVLLPRQGFIQLLPGHATARRNSFALVFERHSYTSSMRPAPAVVAVVRVLNTADWSTVARSVVLVYLNVIWKGAFLITFPKDVPWLKK